MIKSGDKVFCVSQRLSERYGFKLDVIYEVDMALNHGGQNILIIKHCPSNISFGNYAFDVSNFEKVNETNIRRVKISRIKNRMNEK